MTIFNNPRIEKFMEDIRSSSEERYEIALKIRDIFFQCDKELDEDIKYGGLVFLRDNELLGGVFFYKAHISIEFSQGAQLSDPVSVLEGKGKYRRHIKIHNQDEIETKNIIHYVCEALIKIRVEEK